MTGKRQGKLVIVRVTGKNTFERVAEAPIGRWSQGVAFSADSKTILVGNMVEKDISVLRVAEDGKLSEAGPRIRLSGASAALAVAARAGR